jgi:hypothetical protein
MDPVALDSSDPLMFMVGTGASCHVRPARSEARSTIPQRQRN